MSKKIKQKSQQIIEAWCKKKRTLETRSERGNLSEVAQKKLKNEEYCSLILDVFEASTHKDSNSLVYTVRIRTFITMRCFVQFDVKKEDNSYFYPEVESEKLGNNKLVQAMRKIDELDLSFEEVKGICKYFNRYLKKYFHAYFDDCEHLIITIKNFSFFKN